MNILCPHCFKFNCTKSHRSTPVLHLMRLLILSSVSVLTGCQSPVPSNHVSGTLAGIPFVIDGKKQNKLKGVSLEVVSMSATFTNYATLKIESLETLNDPQVISKSYAGAVALEHARWDGLNAVLEKVAQGAVQGAKTAAIRNYNESEIADIERQEHKIIGLSVK